MPFCQIKKPATASENDFYTDQKIDIFIPICKKLAKLLICYVIGVLPNAMHKSLILASEASFVLFCYIFKAQLATLGFQLASLANLRIIGLF